MVVICCCVCVYGLGFPGRPVIANVMKGAHFVLVTGWDSANEDTLYVNDPGFNTQTYSYKDDVVGWRLFDMAREPSHLRGYTATA